MVVSWHAHTSCDMNDADSLKFDWLIFLAVLRLRDWKYSCGTCLSTYCFDLVGHARIPQEKRPHGAFSIAWKFFRRSRSTKSTRLRSLSISPVPNSHNVRLSGKFPARCPANSRAVCVPRTSMCLASHSPNLASSISRIPSIENGFVVPNSCLIRASIWSSSIGFSVWLSGSKPNRFVVFCHASHRMAIFCTQTLCYTLSATRRMRGEAGWNSLTVVFVGIKEDNSLFSSDKKATVYRVAIRGGFAST